MRDLDECRPYVIHLQAEHRRINEVLRDIQDALASGARLRQPQFGQQMDERLKVLRTDLAHHFAEEEEGGCIEEAISRCPNLSEAASTLEEQHAVLLQRLDHLIGNIKRCAEVAGGIESLNKDFTDFAELLRAHEAAENRILQRAFGAEFDV